MNSSSHWWPFSVSCRTLAVRFVACRLFLVFHLLKCWRWYRLYFPFRLYHTIFSVGPQILREGNPHFTDQPLVAIMLQLNPVVLRSCGPIGSSVMISSTFSDLDCKTACCRCFDQSVYLLETSDCVEFVFSCWVARGRGCAQPCCLSSLCMLFELDLEPS